MGITLYGTTPSPPSHSVRLMLERRASTTRIVWLLPGLWPALLRTRGFRGGTVPAMKIDGRRIQGSRAISRALEELKAGAALFPADPEQRVAVEEAERWGDEVLQDVPRRIVRWLSVHRPESQGADRPRASASRCRASRPGSTRRPRATWRTRSTRRRDPERDRAGSRGPRFRGPDAHGQRQCNAGNTEQCCHDSGRHIGEGPGGRGSFLVPFSGQLFGRQGLDRIGSGLRSTRYRMLRAGGGARGSLLLGA